MQETEVGLTSKELADTTYQIMKIPINIRSLREQYLYPLSNMGIINMTRSMINKNENIHSPVEDNIFSIFDTDKDLRLMLSDPALFPDKNLIEQGYSIVVKQEGKRGVENGNFKRYRIVDTDGSEITVDQLISKYLNNPELCFRLRNSEKTPPTCPPVLGSFSNNDKEESSTIDGFSCNYCEFQNANRYDYDKHTVIKHPNQPGYPDRNGKT